MRISKVNYQELLEVMPIVGIILLILLAGVGQTAAERYLQSQQSHKLMIESQQRTAAYQALTSRIEEYRQAFVERDYDTLYRLSYFKGGPQPSLSEYRKLRDAGYTYSINVMVHDIELHGDKAWAALELVLYHPRLGTNKTNHKQEWELLNGLWYKVDYGN